VANFPNNWRFGAGGIDLRRAPDGSLPGLQLAATPQTLTYALASTALIVVDMQNDFCHPSGWLAGIGADIAATAALSEPLSQLARSWKAAGGRIIWLNWGNRHDQANLPPGVRHVYDPDGTGRGIGSPCNPAGTPVLEAGSWNAALVGQLEQVADPTDIRVDKYRMSGFVDTSLDSILRNLRVDTLVFAGVNSDQCVLSTLMDAANIGYDVIMLEDGTATTSPDYCHEAAIYNVRQCFGFTTTVRELARSLPACGCR
jgi:nicotinamidase-related amidase